MNKYDFILISILIIIFLILPFGLFNLNKAEGNTVVCSVDGEVYSSYLLNNDGSFIILTDYGTNTIEIKNGKCKVIDADCAGHDCMRMKSVSSQGGNIVCLPNHLEISVILKNDVDAVTY